MTTTTTPAKSRVFLAVRVARKPRWTVTLTCTDDERFGPSWDAHVKCDGKHAGTYPLYNCEVHYVDGRHRLDAETRSRIVADAKRDWKG